MIHGDATPSVASQVLASEAQAIEDLAWEILVECIEGRLRFMVHNAPETSAEDRVRRALFVTGISPVWTLIQKMKPTSWSGPSRQRSYANVKYMYELLAERYLTKVEQG